MKPYDIVNLAVRLLGLVFLHQGLLQLPSAATEFCGSLLRLNVGGLLFGLLLAGWPLAVAVWLLRGAPLIMRVAYPEAPTAPKGDAPSAGV